MLRGERAPCAVGPGKDVVSVETEQYDACSPVRSAIAKKCPAQARGLERGEADERLGLGGNE
jgi:hypothetical protein